ncbi:VapC toxin family PIN domain ribonuclease [Candidatus Bathyarchaeota archaeon]|nr:MAG: VapC toxin family PIN domain ribonuclease [Candidatus Bathyarchaeota archaeon]
MKHYMVDQMSAFIDTGVFVAARNKREINHEKAVNLLREALKGKYGRIYTSDYIFDEAVTVALVRTRKSDIAIDMGNFILSSKKLRILHVDKLVFMDAWRIFKKYVNKKLSFTDAVSIALMRRYNIDYIMSFDKHFDNIVPRIS